ncbi:MAG: lamin tail domain-containing protein [Patescibacteria group bacterium]
MKKIGTCLMVFCLVLAFWQPLQGRAEPTEPEIPDVIINEIAWAGSSSDGSDEWIELKNTTDSDIPIADWQITKYIKSSDKEALMLAIPADVNPDPEIFTTPIIPKQGYFLISHYGPDDPTGSEKPPSVLSVEPDYKTSSVTLANSNLQIRIYDGPFATSQVIDTAGDRGDGYPFFGSNSAKTSMERDAIFADGDAKNSWHEATESKNLDSDPGVFDKATPKEVNSPEPPPVPTIDHMVPAIPAPVTLDTDFVIEEIVGENFATTENLQVKLEKESNTVPATEWQRIDFPPFTTLTQVRFHIPPDAETGQWDLIIINLDQPDKPAILINAVEILELEEEPEIPVYSDNIILSELYPHPATGQEEYIELYNTGDGSVNLQGWKLDDQSPGGSAAYTISATTIIAPHQYLIFFKSQTHLYLNDTGDYARLLQPNDNLVDSTPNYGTATTGYSYSKINSNWQWSKRVTPNAANIYESTAEEEDEENEIDQDPESLQPNEITIQLEADDIAATSVMLIWKINLPGAIGDIKIYQSGKSGQLGSEIGQTSYNNTEYLVKDLSAKTRYYFTVEGTYNADDVPSNQIEITTANGKAVVSPGDSGIPKQIIISEILPNPNAGDNEFIELYNPSEQAIDITGWKLRDASGKTFVITAMDFTEMLIAATDEEDEEENAALLKPYQYLLLEYPITHIRLNNSGGEAVQLLDPNDNLIDEVSYAGSAKQGEAYVLAPNDHWFWSNETTPGEANDISFASVEGDSDWYLVDSGHFARWPMFCWISLFLSGIILSYLKKYGDPKLHHS